MITSELYPSLPDKAQGFEVSNFIENLDYGTNADHPLRPYIMGYINYEDCPDFINLSEVVATFEEGGENSIKIQPITVRANHAWGYCARDIPDFSFYSTEPFNIVKDENDIWRAKGITSNTNYSNICLVNSGYLASYSLYNKFDLQLSISITLDENNAKPNGFTSNGGISTVSEFLDFCDGNKALTFTYNEHEYEINISDFDKNGYAVLRDIDDTLTFIVGITSYKFNNTGTGAGGGDYLAIIPWIEMEIDGKTYYVNAEASGPTGITDIRLYTNWGSSPMVIGNVVGNVYDNKFMFNLQGEITYEQIQTWAKSYSTEMIHYVQELNCFRSYTGQSQATGYQWRLTPIFKPSGIKTLLALRLKRFIGQETTLLPPTNQRYTTDVDTNKYNSSDVPTFDIINGEYEDIEGQLRPWQRWEVDITENHFNPNDIPPYRPGPEPGPVVPPDEGDWGARVPWNVFQMGQNPFSNFELLEKDGLDEFIGKLWHAPQTFWEALSASKEITANLNDYLISCRAYPIFINAGLQHHDIYLGIGGKITLINNIFTPNIVNTCACGSIAISRPYGNFLDYSPYTSASIYLPFAGQFEVNPKYIYDSALQLILWVDLTDGSGVWTLRNTTHDYPILIKQCKIGIDIPISGQDAAQKGANIINATLNTAQHAISGFHNLLNAGVQVGGALVTGGMTAGSALQAAESAVNTAMTGLSDSYNMAMANKELPYYSTGSAGAAAAEANSEPYITLRFPLSGNPENFAHTIGNLYNSTDYIRNLSGLTICRNVDVSGITQATDKEKAQIKRILESCFYA